MPGKIQALQEISGKISAARPVIKGSVSAIGSLNGSVSSYGSVDDVYDGPYRVSSSTADDVTLDTKGKILKDDLVVNKILYIATDNLFDGVTVYIGEG